MAMQDRLSLFWRTGRADWSRTKAVSLTADVHGYARINLRGREARGIVEPGEEYDRVCTQIAEGLLGHEFGDVWLIWGEPRERVGATSGRDTIRRSERTSRVERSRSYATSLMK